MSERVRFTASASGKPHGVSPGLVPPPDGSTAAAGAAAVVKVAEAVENNEAGNITPISPSSSPNPSVPLVP